MQAEPATNQIQWAICPEQKCVADVTEVRQPLGVRRDRVKFVSVHHQQPAAIDCLVNRLALQRDIAKNAQKICDEFVVVTGDENHFRAFAGFPEQFLHDVIMRLRPVMFPAQPPQIHHVADKAQLVAFRDAQKLQQSRRVTTARAQMQIRNPDCSVAHAQSFPENGDNSVAVLLRNGDVPATGAGCGFQEFH